MKINAVEPEGGGIGREAIVSEEADAQCTVRNHRRREQADVEAITRVEGNIAGKRNELGTVKVPRGDRESR